ncbi:MAG TPA: glycoside hydrolase family 38 C-terminal domain-containing protein [archaeon]|nr:glycoside hydrolase family 38 C-terminal domain-containing protein [archaeon]
MKYFMLVALLFFAVFSASTAHGENMRTAHYIPSTHWDREWYEPFQGFRMRLVSLLDELFETLEKDPAYKCFLTDGQIIPIYDYLEIRPEKRELVERYVREGRLKPGPWYVQPDEWLVSGESLVRNLQLGMKLSRELGAPLSWGGFACDQFGHVGQLPQIFDQLNIPVAFVWRGLKAKESTGHFNWKAPDGTVIPSYRFGTRGYSTYSFAVRGAIEDRPFDLEKAVGRLVEYVLEEAGRSTVKPILLFDGGDHMEIEPQTSALIARANEKLEPRGIRIIHSDPDSYMKELLADRGKIEMTFAGEMRESRRDDTDGHLIPGVLSSRIHLKQRNAACEDELCLWAEPFSTFVAVNLGREYPKGYLHVAWKHLVQNHPHDSMCACSIDQVHQDMIYRFDQSLGISSRLTAQALKDIAKAAAPKDIPEGSLVLAVFNATAEDINEPVDLDIPLPVDWPKRFAEFFGYEEKFSFRLINAQGEEVPYQLVGQIRDHQGFWRQRYHFPTGDTRHIIKVTAPLRVPAFGYTTLIVKPVDGPTRYLGSMAVSHRAVENETLLVQAETNGTISITDKRTGRKYEQLLTFEDRADIGDGWYHGVAVNDYINLSTACGADIAVIADGIAKATIRIAVTMNVPQQFDFKNMERCGETAPLKIVSDVTLRKGSDRVEVATTVDNTILDHRLRVLFPTNLKGDTYLSNSAFDVVERPVALASDNNLRDELDVETRPQISWTAFGDGVGGLAVVSRGLPESAVINNPERPIALTLFRAFRRAVFSNDNPGGQIQGKLVFRYDIVPVAQKIPVNRLFVLGQRVNGPTRVIDLLHRDLQLAGRAGALPRELSFLKVTGNAVFTSVQLDSNKMSVRLFNPHGTKEKITITLSTRPGGAKCVTLDGRDDTRSSAQLAGNAIEVSIPAKRISTVVIE